MLLFYHCVGFAWGRKMPHISSCIDLCGLCAVAHCGVQCMDKANLRSFRSFPIHSPSSHNPFKENQEVQDCFAGKDHEERIAFRRERTGFFCQGYLETCVHGDGSNGATALFLSAWLHQATSARSTPNPLVPFWLLLKQQCKEWCKIHIKKQNKTIFTNKMK